MRRRLLSVLAVGNLLPFVSTCDVTHSLTLEQVLRQMSERDRVRSHSIGRYTCMRRYVLNNRRFRVHAELTARMTYSYPGRKTFEVLAERGPWILRRKVLHPMLDAEQEASRDRIRPHVQITRLNYEFRLLGGELVQGRSSYILEIVPKVASKFAIRGRIWVDSQDFAIVRVEGAPAQNPSPWIRDTHIVQKYTKVGSLWLPLSNDSGTDSVVFGPTEVSITSWDYQVTQNNGPSPSPLAPSEQK